MAKLTIFYGDERKNVYKIRKDVVTVGRVSECDVEVPASSISRYHARVERRTSGYYVIDNNSTNGTLVNGMEIKEARLSDGDEIYMGEAVILFSYDEHEYEETARDNDTAQPRDESCPSPVVDMSREARTTTRLKIVDLQKKIKECQGEDGKDPLE